MWGTDMWQRGTLEDSFRVEGRNIFLKKDKLALHFMNLVMILEKESSHHFITLSIQVLQERQNVKKEPEGTGTGQMWVCIPCLPLFLSPQ